MEARKPAKGASSRGAIRQSAPAQGEKIKIPAKKVTKFREVITPGDAATAPVVQRRERGRKGD